MNMNYFLLFSNTKSILYIRVLRDFLYNPG